MRKLECSGLMVVPFDKGVPVMQPAVQFDVLVGTRGFGAEMLGRLSDYGVELNHSSNPFPPLPYNFFPRLGYDVGGPKWKPISRRDQFVVLPLVLVADVTIQALGGCRFKTASRFYPYWLHDVTIGYEGFHPDWNRFRPLNGVEAACAAAQYELRVRFYSHRANGFWGEALFNGRKIRVDHGSSPWGQNRAFVPRNPRENIDYHGVSL